MDQQGNIGHPMMVVGRHLDAQIGSLYPAERAANGSEEAAQGLREGQLGDRNAAVLIYRAEAAGGQLRHEGLS